MTGWWYLSFADKEQFRGCCFVQASDLRSAVRESIAQGCNAGRDTSVMGSPVRDGVDVPPWSLRNRLLTQDELEVWRPTTPIGA